VKVAETRTLPDPDAKPDADVVLWDGECTFCRSQVQRLRHWDGDRLAYLSLHDPRVVQRYPELSREQLMEQMWVVTVAGQRFGGADAVRYLSRQLPWLWPLAPVMHVPGAMPLWRRLYAWVAQRRYRIAGRDCAGGSCALHIRSEKTAAAPATSAGDQRPAGAQHPASDQLPAHDQAK
jgi:predicted DCC family thiol-disulfide oxidoreductase YuxK